MEQYPQQFPQNSADYVFSEYVDIFLRKIERRGEDDGKCDPMAEFEDACENGTTDGENISVADFKKVLADEYRHSMPEQAILTLMLKSLEVADAMFEGIDTFTVPVSGFNTLFRDYYVNREC